MLIVENRFKTFFKLLWNKIKIFFTIVGVLVFFVGSGFVLTDLSPLKNEEIINNLETRIEVLETIHNIEEVEENG